MRTKKCVAISIYTLTREVVFDHNEIKREFCTVINCLILTRTDLHIQALKYLIKINFNMFTFKLDTKLIKASVFKGLQVENVIHSIVFVMHVFLKVVSIE